MGDAIAPGAPQPGPDGRLRCPWALAAPDYTRYHDEEWGRPLRDEDGLFERVSLEAFQSGLSWLTILRKRDAFRAAFAAFDVERVAGFGSADVERLLADAAIVRNRAKIEATIANARAVVALHDRGGSLAEIVWRHAPTDDLVPTGIDDVPATTTESRALARALKAEGLVWIGPTTALALMQACGVVDHHLAGCAFRSKSGERTALHARARGATIGR